MNSLASDRMIWMGTIIDGKIPMTTFQDVLHSVANSAGGKVQGADIVALLDAKAAGRSDQIEWRYSIADLMKALGLPSDLPSRAALARELGYSGALNGS